MPPPLEDELVEFDDGHENSVEQMSQDVAAFLMWTAEPKMMARKRMGLLSVLFLSLFTVLLYLTNKKLWAPIKRKDA
jgi:ubiquinol-cytochrome c reductase cytochrome c1 subunit